MSKLNDIIHRLEAENSLKEIFQETVGLMELTRRTFAVERQAICEKARKDAEERGAKGYVVPMWTDELATTDKLRKLFIAAGIQLEMELHETSLANALINVRDKYKAMLEQPARPNP